MSLVTNLLLSFDIMEDEKALMGQINEWLNENAAGQQLVPTWELEEAYGGHKHMEVPLWAAAFNYLDLDGFLAELRSARWKYPNNVRVFVAEQEDSAVRMIEL